MEKKELLRKSVLFGVGVAAYAHDQAEKLAKELISKGHFNPAEGQRLVQRVYREANISRKRISKVLEQEMNRLLRTKK